MSSQQLSPAAPASGADGGALADLVAAWQASTPKVSGDFALDRGAFSDFWSQGRALLQRLPAKPARTPAQQAAAETLLTDARALRTAFLSRHAARLYDLLTEGKTRFVRLEQLVARAAELVPGLTPDAATLAREEALPQSGKDGHEIDQGLFLNHVLAERDCGLHLCHAHLLPSAQALADLPRYRAEGQVDYGTARVERRRRAAIVTMSNKRFLNAEDETTVDAFEWAVDLALLDDMTEICVLRGDVVEHPKYVGRRVMGTGINLTLLYQGKISVLWYLKREFGYINKIYRGLARPEISPDELLGETHEKPWVAQLDGFAIGGTCQVVLVCDYVVAGTDAYMTLPARKEGIIPGFANLRLWRLTGDRLARQAIQSGWRIDCDSEGGRRICDELVRPEETDAAVARVVEGYLASGVVSAAANRRAFRIGQEPLDLFRQYAAFYAREQANCHFSPQLIGNLERFWNAQARRV